MKTIKLEIIKEYENYYGKLLKIRKAEPEEEKKAEKQVEEKFKKIIAETQPREIITEKIVEIAIKGMKNKKASDRYGWKAEWIKNGGKEMNKSLTVLYNRTEEEKCVPDKMGTYHNKISAQKWKRKNK